MHVLFRSEYAAQYMQVATDPVDSVTVLFEAAMLRTICLVTCCHLIAQAEGGCGSIDGYGG